MKFLRLLAYFISLTLVLGQFSRIPISVGEFSSANLYLNDILLPLFIFLWLGYKLAIQKRLRLPPFWGWIAIFIGIAFISLLNGLRWVDLGQWVVGSFYLARWVEYAFFYWVIWDLAHTAYPQVFDPHLTVKQSDVAVRPLEYSMTANYSFRSNIIKLLVFSFTIFSILGLLQLIFFPDFSKYTQHGWDPHYYRVLSTFFDPNFAGIFMVLGFFLLAALILETKEKKNGISFLILLAILLTFSRSTYLALAVGVGIIGLLRSRRLLLIFVLLGLASILLVPRVRVRVAGIVRPDVTARLRLKDWQKTFKIIKNNWFLGVGFNTLRYTKEHYGYFRDERGVIQPSGHAGAGADSSFLFLWSTTGIFGLLIYLAFLGNVWLRAWQTYKQKLKTAVGQGKVISLTLIAGIPALVLHSQFVNSLFYPWIMEIVWILIALL